MLDFTYRLIKDTFIFADFEGKTGVMNVNYLLTFGSTMLRYRQC